MLNLKTIAMSAVIALGASTAHAATVYCPGTEAVTDREFSITTDPVATCVTWGPGNTDSSPGEEMILAAIGDAVLLDKSDEDQPGSVEILVTGIEMLSGTWEILVPDGFVLSNVFLALKSGQGQLDPDWALFSIPDGVLSGSWSIASGSQSLSHMSLYGTLAPIPLPAAGFLMLGALGALGVAARRRKA